MSDQNDRLAKPPCRRTALEILGYFVACLREEIIATGKPLSLEPIERMADRVFAEKSFETVYDRCYGEFTSLRIDEKRKDVIGRLIVQRIVPLLSNETNPEPGSKKMSRWIIPEYIALIKMMIGEVVYEEFNARAKRLLQDLRSRLNKPLVWPDLFEDENAGDLVDILLIRMAPTMRPFEQRREWVINTLNTKLLERKSGEAEDPSRGRWLFEADHFSRLLSALYKRLKERMATDESRAPLVAVYGDRIKVLEDLLQRMSGDVT